MDLLFKYLKNSLDNLVFLGLFIGVLGYWVSIAFPSFKIGSKIGFYSVLFSNVFVTIILTWRWVESGYFPLSNLYESLLFFTWGITFLSLILESLTSLTLLGAISTPLSMFIVGFATLSLPDGMQKAAPLVPALKSNWIMMKGSSVGNINIQGSTTDLQLEYEPQDGILEKKLNLLESLDNLSYRIIGLGFPLLTIGIIAGAVWANEAWGSYWSWDPKETWALITWLVFAAYLHTRITKSWQGKGPAVLASLGFVVVWICYLGVNFLGKGLHSYGWIA